MDVVEGLTTSEFCTHLRELIERIAGTHERIALTHDGKPVAALVPLGDLEILENVEVYIDNELADVALEEAKEHGTISLADLKAGLGLYDRTCRTKFGSAPLFGAI